MFHSSVAPSPVGIPPPPPPAKRPPGADVDPSGAALRPSNSLQHTLDHPDGFTAFRNWLAARGRAEALELWLAIWAFRRALREHDPRAFKIGMAFHRTFVSLRTGQCTFLPPKVRRGLSERIQMARDGPLSIDTFDECIPHTWARLAEEHAQFMRDCVACNADRDEKLAFARELAEKLGRLAVEREVHGGQHNNAWDWGWKRANGWVWDEEDTLPPERVCQWMGRRGDSLPFDSSGSSATSSFPTVLAGDFRQRHESGDTGARLFHQTSLQQHRTQYSDSSGFCSSSKSCLNLPGALAETASVGDRSSSSSSLLTVTYRECGGTGPPFVVRIDTRKTQLPLTFRDFRRLFAIPSRANKRFLFKELCAEDECSPFQWTVVCDDATPLPVYQGRVVAECRTLSESE